MDRCCGTAVGVSVSGEHRHRVPKFNSLPPRTPRVLHLSTPTTDENNLLPSSLSVEVYRFYGILCSNSRTASSLPVRRVPPLTRSPFAQSTSPANCMMHPKEQSLLMLLATKAEYRRVCGTRKCKSESRLMQRVASCENSSASSLRFGPVLGRWGPQSEQPSGWT